jgi:hypothetical protein
MRIFPWKVSNDFLQRLNANMERNVLQYLEALADIAHFAAISRSWRQFGFFQT